MSTFKLKIFGWLGRHFLFWLADVVFFTILLVQRLGSVKASFQTSLLHLPFYMLLVYWMIYGLLPKLLDGKYGHFLIGLAIFFSVSFVGNIVFRAWVLIPFQTSQPSPIIHGTIHTAYLTVFTVGSFITAQGVVWAALSIKLVRYWYQKEQVAQQLAHETLTVELQLLKAQIHPHFLFNTLNNLYSLTLRQSSNAPDIVLKLSSLLNYMLHECSRPTVPLFEEIAFLNNYIELEKLRYGKRLIVTKTVQGNIDDNKIVPLLLIPFLENAFKHGSSQQTDQARIDLQLDVQDNTMTFRLENNTNSRVSSRPDRTVTGIGLANVRKRLQLLYPDGHKLTIQPHNDRFVVDLSISLGRLLPTIRNASLF